MLMFIIILSILESFADFSIIAKICSKQNCTIYYNIKAKLQHMLKIKLPCSFSLL